MKQHRVILQSLTNHQFASIIGLPQHLGAFFTLRLASPRYYSKAIEQEKV